MIEIDGSYGEGGGSILRVAAGLSVVTGEPFHAFKIRANREKPGLREQHWMGLRATAEICGGSLKGAEIGSTDVVFTPRDEWKKRLHVRIGTAGSVGLALQPLQIACLRAPHKVEISVEGGATYGKWAPSVHFLQEVTYKQLSQMGYKATLDVEKHGFYPVGGAKVRATFSPPGELKPLNRGEFGEVSQIRGISVADARLRLGKVAERQKVSLRQEIFKQLSQSAQISEEYVDAACPGTGLTTWAETTTGCVLGASTVGEKRLRAEKVGKIAAKALCEEVSQMHFFDEHAPDQILPFIALCQQPSQLGSFTRTNHFNTNRWVLEQFLHKTLSF